MDVTTQFIIFWLLRSSYNLFNVFLRFTFNRCLMYGKVDDGKTRSIKVKLFSRAKSRGSSAVRELASLDSFIFYYDSDVQDIETEIRKPEVSLYGFSRDFAYFSVVSHGLNVWDGVFSSPEQFNKAQYLILVPLKEFYQISESLNSTQYKKIIFLHHTDRCGSTLVTAMFKRLPDTCVISGPESFYSAYHLYHVHKTVTQEQYEKMIQAAVITHSLTQHKTIFIKMVGVASISQMSLIYDLFPQSKTAFLSRNSMDVLNSFMIIINSCHPTLHRILGYSRKQFINEAVWARKNEKFPQDIADVILCVWKICMENVETAKMPVKSFNYEELVSDPKKTVLDLLRFFDLTEDHLEIMIQAMEHDSQEGTRISRSALKQKST